MGSIHCIVCNKVLEIEEADRPVTHSHDGVLCHEMTMDGVDCVAHGNYGSTAYDPIHSQNGPLGFVLCDECFWERRDRMVSVDAGGPGAPEDT